MTQISPLRPLFVRSSLIAGWIVGGALGLLAGRYVTHPAACPPPIVEAIAEAPPEPPEPPAPEADEPDPHDQMVPLQLEVTESDPSCAYYSAFDTGEVELPRGADQATLQRDFDFLDGCRWRSEERLEKGDDGRYRYRYSERAVSCSDGREPAGACTRSGFAVPVTDVD